MIAIRLANRGTKPGEYPGTSLSRSEPCHVSERSDLGQRHLAIRLEEITGCGWPFRAAGDADVGPPQYSRLLLSERSGGVVVGATAMAFLCWPGVQALQTPAPQLSWRRPAPKKTLRARRGIISILSRVH